MAKVRDVLSFSMDFRANVFKFVHETAENSVKSTSNDDFYIYLYNILFYQWAASFTFVL